MIMPTLRGGAEAPRRRMLGRRLARAVVLSSASALLLAGLFLDAFVYVSLKKQLVEDVSVEARIMAENSSAAVAFDDGDVAASMLGGLQVSPTIRAAELRGPSGQVIARYAAPHADAVASSGLLGQALGAGQGHAFAADHLIVQTPVLQNGHGVGTLRLVATLAPLRQRMTIYVLATLVASAIAFGVAYGLVIRMRREVDTIESRLDYLAFYDPVTGLRNRAAALDRLSELMAPAPAGRPAFKGAVVLIDLDDFKLVNDSLGHGAGDQVLRQAAERLTRYVHRDDNVFRFGGDEFMVIAPDVDDLTQLRMLGRAAAMAFEEPLRAEGQEIYVRNSVGLARYPLDASDAASLVRAADTAMYSAKALGKNTFQIFTPEMDRTAQSRIRLDKELRLAIERGELSLVFQPVVDLRSQKIVGAEALLRWKHPELGQVSPTEFIPIAEVSGQIVDIGRWVLESACRQLRAWSELALPRFYVAINVSARQLKRDFVGLVRAALEATAVDASRLEIEITETSMVDDLSATVAELSSLRDLGVGVAVDDFGTGVSSLAYLKRLPISKLKIDRAFIKELPQSADDGAIVAAILSMAARLELTVVAEGVETQAQREFLLEAGLCHFIQGYLYSPPVDAERLTALLGRQASAGTPWAEPMYDERVALHVVASRPAFGVD